jgi:ATP-dependent RNA helicase RhlE
MTQFSDLGLSAPLLAAVAAEGYSVPTPIQISAIPHVLAGRDLMATAQTGTGKTAAFALPLLERLHNAPARPHKIRLLVLAPTRELACQIYESFCNYGRQVSLRSTVIYGGVSQRPQQQALARGVDVLVATPGRLIDLIGQKLVDLRHVEALVLDEADRMLDMGFIRDVRRIAAILPRERQTLLFSATLPEEVRKLSASLLDNPVVVQTARESAPAVTVEQAVYLVPQKNKRQLLVHLLAHRDMSRVLVFTRTKHAADRLQRDLTRAGMRAEALHGNKSQNKREQVLREFRSNRPPVLVATDIAARGLDVDDVSHVFNYDLPHEPETYVHRIGRTGRAGATGIAVSFCDGEERSRLRAIERLIRASIPVRTDHPTYRAETLPDRAPPIKGKVRPAHGGGRPKPAFPGSEGAGKSGPRKRGRRTDRRGGRPLASGRA